MITSRYTKEDVFIAGNFQVYPDGYVVYWDTPVQSSAFTPQFVALVNGIDLKDVRLDFISFLNGIALYNVFHKVYLTITASLPLPPSYIDLLSGYSLDSRKLPSGKIRLLPINTESVTISYYRNNHLEPSPVFKSIDWVKFEVNLVKGEPYWIDLTGLVLGTITVNSSDILSQITSYSVLPGEYSRLFYIKSNLNSLFNVWRNMFDSVVQTDTPLVGTIINNVQVLNQTSQLYTGNYTIRKLAANNDAWKNTDLSSNIDVNPDPEHPMFKVDRDRAYQWHLKEVSQGIGDLVMDSVRMISIEAALNAYYYSIDPTTGESRVANLGHLIEKIAAFVGYRPEPDGTLNHDKEKAKVRTVISKDNPIDPSKVGVNSFGEQGMVVRRLNNAFTGKEITANECVLVRDLPQLLAEYQDQINLAIGLQESSAISVETQNGTAKYENQLAVLTELLNLSISNHDMIRSALVSVMVAQGQTSEIIAGMGLPSVTKTIPVEIDGKISDLPYQGIAAHRSISQEIAVCTQNVGIVAGQLL
jgi:hypothetical protein